MAASSQRFDWDREWAQEAYLASDFDEGMLDEHEVIEYELDYPGVSPCELIGFWDQSQDTGAKRRKRCLTCKIPLRDEYELTCWKCKCWRNLDGTPVC